MKLYLKTGAQRNIDYVSQRGTKMLHDAKPPNSKYPRRGSKVLKSEKIKYWDVTSRSPLWMVGDWMQNSSPFCVKSWEGKVSIISQEFQLKLQIPVSYFLHVDLHVRKML